MAMNLIPFSRSSLAVRGLGQEIDRLLSDIFGGSPMQRLWGAGDGRGAFLPACDVRETETDVLVEAELPGMDPNEVQVSLENGRLWLCGERKHEEETKTKNVHRVERSFGSFERQIELPDGINTEDVDASYKDGVLKIRIGKREEARPRTIKVKVEKK